MSNKVINSDVHYQDKVFFVSTINRESSAVFEYGRIYAETMVWELGEGRSRGDYIYMGSSRKDDLLEHFRVCQLLHNIGKPEMGVNDV